MSRPAGIYMELVFDPNRHYHGKVCITHNTSIRDKHHRTCVMCIRDRDRRRRKERAEAKLNNQGLVVCQFNPVMDRFLRSKTYEANTFLKGYKEFS